MLTQRRYKVIHEEHNLRVTNEYADTYLLGIRIKRVVIELTRRGINISLGVRNLIPILDGNECVYCQWNTAQDQVTKKPRGFSIDHIVPQIQGGNSGIFNLVWACVRCNSSKQGRTPAEAGMSLSYGRYRQHNRKGPFPPCWAYGGVTIPPSFTQYIEHQHCYSHECYPGTPLPSWLTDMAYMWDKWLREVRKWKYDEPFETEFIQRDGRLPYAY